MISWISEIFQGHVVITGPGGVVHSEGSGASPLPAPINFTLDATGEIPGDYTITANFTNSAGCSDSLSSMFTLTAPAACCIAPLPPDLGPATGVKSTRDSDLSLPLINNCGTDLDVTRMDITWTDLTGNGTLLKEICWDMGASTPPEDCDLFSVATFAPPAFSPTSAPFIPGLFMGSTRDSGDPLTMGFAYDVALTDGGAIGERITADIFYLASGAPSEAVCESTARTAI